MRQKASQKTYGLGLLIVALLSLSLSACQTPSQTFAKQAADFNFRESGITGKPFQHRLFANSAALKADSHSETLHVYLDGDGSPWVRHRWVADDPTSKYPLILKLMRLDPGPAIMLGRPCYHGLQDSSVCLPRYWTSHRYAQVVVVSMAQALRRWIVSHQYQRVVLIGYSGGGVLAMLMAPYISAVKTVVTVAANLDVAAWSEFHGYLPLTDSLNPAFESINGEFRQIHIAGGLDRNVPASIIQSVAQQQAGAEFVIYEQHNHVCCWENNWPEILQIYGN